MNEIIVDGWNIYENPGNLRGHWITGEEVGKHLEYSDPSKAIRNIFNRNKDTFIEGEDTTCLKMRREGNLRNTRLFSQKGVLKLIRFSSQPIAHQVIDEVFDVYVSVNEKQKAIDTNTSPTKVAKQVFEDILAIADMCDCPKNLAIFEASKHAKLISGVDTSKLISTSKEMENVDEETMMLEPTDLGKRLGISGKAMNKFLEKIGWQYRENKVWHPTKIGEKYSKPNMFLTSYKHGYNLKWNVKEVVNQYKKSIDS